MEWLGGTSPEVLHGQSVHTKVTKAKAKKYIVNILELEKSRVDHLGWAVTNPLQKGFSGGLADRAMDRQTNTRFHWAPCKGYIWTCISSGKITQKLFFFFGMPCGMPWQLAEASGKAFVNCKILKTQSHSPLLALTAKKGQS